MQTALHVIAYDVNRYINEMLRNIPSWVDKVYLAYPQRPWNYIPTSRETRVNPTKLTDIDLTGLDFPVDILEGDWQKDEDTRNACLSRAKAEGFDWLITQDADEFYSPDTWMQLKRELEKGANRDCFKTTWYTFWKSSEFVIVEHGGSIKGTNAGFALRCKGDLKFAQSRSPNTSDIRVLDCPCYHYGYVKSDQEMFEKVTQWGHAHQFNGARWFNIKWKNWNLRTQNLGPVVPRSWQRAIRFPLHQPDFAFNFVLPIEEHTMSGNDVLSDLLYDTAGNSIAKMKALKRLIITR
jgi:hypothetical protein